MDLNHFVIHELSKEVRGTTTGLTLSQALPLNNAISKNLIISLNEKYKTRETYGRFAPETTNIFPQEFQQYVAGGYTSETFLNFSQTVMRTLRDQVQNIPLAKGGFFVFADYSSTGGSFLSIFLVRNTNGFLFDNQNAIYDVRPQAHVEIEKLAMGCKINKVRYSNSEVNYLSFIRTSKQNTSDYFINWISATELRLNSEYTSRLCDIIKQIDIPEIDGSVPSRDEFQKMVYAYCNGVPGGKLSLTELSLRFYGEGEETKIIDYALEHNIQIDTEFRAAKDKLKKLYRIDVSSEDINLRFDFESLNSKIRVDNNRVIIESASLALKIQREMM